MDNSVIGSAEKLKQLKQLLDIGAITQEEFEYKKIALLNPDKEEKYLKALNLIKHNDENSLSNAVMLFKNLGDYRDAEILQIEAVEKFEVAKKENIYKKAVSLILTETIESQRESITEFNKILDYKDSANRIEIAKEKIDIIHKKEEEKRIQEEKLAEERQIADTKKAKKNKITTIVISVVIILLILVGIIINTSIKTNKYENAVELLASEQYKDAHSVFVELGDFKDSQDKAQESHYLYANELYKSKKYDEALKIYESLENYKESKNKISNIKFINKINVIKKAKKGDVVKYGSYEQDGNSSNGNEEIEWIVLEKKKGKVLLLSKYILDDHVYNDEEISITWEKCSLRKWLNNDFFENAFSKQERKYIVTTNNINKGYVDNGVLYDLGYRSTKGGNDTKDKVFLLSTDECYKYFPNGKGTIAEAKSEVNQDSFGEGTWWLRSVGDTEINSYGNGKNHYKAAYAGNVNDIIADSGTFVDLYNGVRPSVWINIK